MPWASDAECPRAGLVTRSSVHLLVYRITTGDRETRNRVGRREQEPAERKKNCCCPVGRYPAPGNGAVVAPSRS